MMMRMMDVVDYWLARDADNYYLKEILGESALHWVQEQNQEALNVLGNPEEENTDLYNQIKTILDSKEKIPYLRKIGNQYYNFWQDGKNPRGLFRRISKLEEYFQLEINWEIVLDLDELGKLENESWVYHGLVTNSLQNTDTNRMLVRLSKGGSDAVVVREFDLTEKKFVADEQAFILPEAKSRVCWKSENELIIGADFGDGDSLTDSGYPRQVKIWKRGTSFKDAKLIYEGSKTDVRVSGHLSRHQSHVVIYITRAIDYFTSEKLFSYHSPSYRPYHQDSDQVDEEEFLPLPIPFDTVVSHFLDQFLITLRSDWIIQDQIYSKGSLLAIPIHLFLLQKDKPVEITPADVTVLFNPSFNTSLDNYIATKDYLLVTTLSDVKTQIFFWKFHEETSTWLLVDFEPEPQISGVLITAVDAHESNQVWYTKESWTQPTTLYLVDVSKGVKGIMEAPALKQLSQKFNFQNEFREIQFKAISKDGTPVPYFLLHHKDMEYHGENPTILYGYGGFGTSSTPSYEGIIGSCWLSHSSFVVSKDSLNHQSSRYPCYAVANIRGGGEYGPFWHKSAVKSLRQNAYDDFIAVAEDLIQRKITSVKNLGIQGTCNGGLLMGNMIIQRPDLFGAVHCEVPLFNMKEYNKLLAGASYMAEYGNPDTEDWDNFLKKYSPYHHIIPNEMEGNKLSIYPPVMVTASTKDDRIHPYHARGFVKRLKNGGKVDKTVGIHHGDVIYYENTEGGHRGAADNKQRAFVSALSFNFFFNTIGKN